MKLTFIFNEMPYPPNHGGRVDAWRRIKAFKQAGVSLQFIAWQGDRPESRPTPEQLKELSRYVDEIHLFTIGSDWASRVRRIFNLTRYSSHAASRLLSGNELQGLRNAVKKFNPSAIWLDAIYGGVLARQLALQQGVSFYVRSHNLEHRYMARQAGLATNLRDRLAWGLAVFHLEEFETSLLRDSRRYYDCSYDDLQFWQARGVSNGRYLPQTIEPEVDFAGSDYPPVKQGEFDVVFMGNLHSPNNVEGLLWFFGKVLPRVLEKIPQCRVLVAGSKPCEEIRTACERFDGVTLIPNPENSADMYRAGKVLINPVLSGSGVMVKSIEMIFFDGALVCTHQGVYGVPPEVKACFAVSDDPEVFASNIVDSLSGKAQQDRQARTLAREVFGMGAIQSVVDEINADISSEGSSTC
jgi:hypothetical protein